MNRRQFISILGTGSGVTLLSQCAGVSLVENLAPSLLITPHKISTRLGQHFPVVKSYQSGLAKLQFSDPVCSIVPNQQRVRVGLSISAFLNFYGKAKPMGGGLCQLACGVHYDPSSRGIFLKNPILEQFQLSGLDGQWMGAAKDIANLVGKQYVERYPVYTLPESFGVRFLKSMTTENEGIRLRFGM